MNYIRSLEDLRKKIQGLSIVEEVKTAVEPVRPSGFMPQIARARGAPVEQPQVPQYQPDMIIDKTFESIQKARLRYQKQMLEAQKVREEEKSNQIRPRVRPFNVENVQSGGFMTRPYSREDAIRDRSEFDSTNRPRGPAGSGAPMEELAAVAQAIKDIESSGGNYQARGPVVETGMYAGERAMGAYQVMPGNLPQWSREALGREVTEQEFMASEEIQDTIFLHQMQKAYQEHGTWEDAASIWFTGQPVSRSANRSDGYTSAPDYIQKFSSAFNRYRSGE